MFVVACGGESVSTAQRLVLGVAQRTFSDETAQVAFVIDGLGEQVVGEGQIDFGAQQSATTTAGLADGDTKVVVDEDTTFVRAAGLTPPDDFIVSDPTDDLQADGLGVISQLLVLLQPIQLLQLLDAADDAQDLGSEPVDGVDTTHVQATVDLAAALDLVEGPTRRALQQALTGLDTDTVTFDVFIDASGRVRKLKAALTLNDGTRVTSTQRFTAFGESVSIHIPPERRQLSAADGFAIASADISGTWTVSSKRTESTDTEALPLGPSDEAQIEIVCGSDGSCSTGNGAWDSVGGGEFTLTRTDTADCVTRDTGAITVADGFTGESSQTVTVTEAAAGGASTMSGTAVVNWEATEAAQAEECRYQDGTFTATETLEFTYQRTG